MGLLAWCRARRGDAAQTDAAKQMITTEVVMNEMPPAITFAITRCNALLALLLLLLVRESLPPPPPPPLEPPVISSAV